MRLLQLFMVLVAQMVIPRVPKSFPYEAVGIPRDYPWNCGKVEVPVWLYGGHAIWGMTARIVRDLVSHL